MNRSLPVGLSRDLIYSYPVARAAVTSLRAARTCASLAPLIAEVSRSCQASDPSKLRSIHDEWPDARTVNLVRSVKMRQQKFESFASNKGGR